MDYKEKITKILSLMNEQQLKIVYQFIKGLMSL